MLQGAGSRPGADSKLQSEGVHHGPTEAFGEIALLEEGSTRSATVVALERAESRVIHKLDFDALQARHPVVGDVLARALALRVRRLSELLVEAHYVPAQQRVLRRIAELAAGGSGGRPPIVPLIQEQLSNLAGTSRATVNRVLREAQSRGEIELGRGHMLRAGQATPPVDGCDCCGEE